MSVQQKDIAFNHPHELHANITPFPLDRKERTALARRLAVVSRLEIMPLEDTDPDT